MATNKNLRTPIIKPRVQGGTFYTFGSAMEDIGLNINDTINKISLSHYVLLDIPSFDKELLKDSSTYEGTNNPGDQLFAEYLQNGILNMETVVRNTDGYNYSAEKTVSERAFWKFIFDTFKPSGVSQFDSSGNYLKEASNAEYKPIAKCMGKISAGSQRSDEYGIYNETFVQIPSSYGLVPILFKKVNDENYKQGKTYTSTNTENLYIEGINPDTELSGDYLKSTGINAKAHYDSSANKSYSVGANENLEVEFDTTAYGAETFDDLAIGDAVSDDSKDFTFNAVLVYYSVYDTNSNATLATNAFGLYILDNSKISEIDNKYKFNSLNKRKGNASQIGNSFSFRLNIKPSSAYNGDVVVNDNSTSTFAESTDFNDIIRNMSAAVTALKSNARLLYKISSDNDTIKEFALSTISKVDDVEQDVATLKTGKSLSFDTLYQREVNPYANVYTDLDSQTAENILNKISVKVSDENNIDGIVINTDGLSETDRVLAESLLHIDSSGKECYDIGRVLALIIAKLKSL